MQKIPVGATIAHAYRFAFGSFFTLLRVLWIALALQLVLMIPLLGRMVLFLQAMRNKDPAALSFLGPFLLVIPFALVLFFVQLTAVTETALGRRTDSSWFQFPVGKKMWRLFGGFILAGLAIGALAVCYFVTVGLLAFFLKPVAGKDGAALLALVLVLVGEAGMAFLAVRFLFLLAPVNIAEQRMGVDRAWMLSRGNFWRSFWIILSVYAPFLVVQEGLMVAFAGWPPAFGAGEAARLAWNIAALSAMVRHWPVLVPIHALVMVLYLGAGCGAQAFAYRKLTEGDASAPVAGD